MTEAQKVMKKERKNTYTKHATKFSKTHYESFVFGNCWQQICQLQPVFRLQENSMCASIQQKVFHISDDK